MKRFIFLIFASILLSIGLIGCQSGDNTLKMDKEITKVSISKSNGFGQINPEFFAEYDDEKTIKALRSIFSNMVKEQMEVSMAEPEFDVNVKFKDGSEQGFHLWIGEKGQRSTLMEIENTNTIYTVSEEMTNMLLDLILALVDEGN
ncbi:hypothetical protein [Planococcus lenghuensis]|uniref:YhfM-like domain-containing protein n=1 Tax=Planococcus lenghuensis TaxID=2213202 RepID=A0A1Q2KZB0_9BACL|nr:hypothetical protein [Planococcus lenghuensis]AQQ52972.1 hypothetical protein B0X71_07635 [Planococcus lenghuensis]